MKSRMVNARIMNPDVFDKMKAGGGIVDVDAIPDLDELIAKMESEYSGQSTGSSQSTGNDMVSVQLPDGRKGSIPRSKLQQAIDQGAKVVE